MVPTYLVDQKGEYMWLSSSNADNFSSDITYHTDLVNMLLCTPYSSRSTTLRCR